MIKFFSVHFIANLTTNPNDNSFQLSLDVYYVSVTLNLSEKTQAKLFQFT